MYFFKARTTNRNYYIKSHYAIRNRDTMAKLINLEFDDCVYVDGFKVITVIEYLLGRLMTR